MTDEMKRTATCNKAYAEVMRDIGDLSVAKGIATAYKEACRKFEVAAISFNKLRKTMVECKNMLWAMDLSNKMFVKNMRELFGADCDAYVANVTKFGGECDGDEFMEHMALIGRKTNPITRIAMAREAIEKIDESIEGWKSKMTRIDSMVERENANENESSVAIRKRYAIEAKLSTLVERRKALSGILGSSKRSVEKFLNK